MENICFLFPGQGSQYVGMAQGFYDKYKDIFKESDEILGLPLTKIMFEGPIEELTKTNNAQPAILLHSYLALKHFSLEIGYKPSFALGHSLGEYSALVAAKVLDFKTALFLVHERGKLMANASTKESAMAAVLGMDAKKIETILAPFSDEQNDFYVSIANYNGDAQTVISGTKLGVLKAKEELIKNGAKKIIELTVSAPFHCALMKPVALEMGDLLKTINFADAAFPIISNISTKPEQNGQRLKSLMIEQIANPVRFTGCMNTLKELCPDIAFVELGPKTVLSSLVKKVFTEAQIKNIDQI